MLVKKKTDRKTPVKSKGDRLGWESNSKRSRTSLKDTVGAGRKVDTKTAKNASTGSFYIP